MEEASKKTTNIKGNDAEDAFLRAFYKLKIGGLLILGFNSIEFANKTNMMEAFKNISEFEVDAVYFHPLLGIIFFEIKSVENKSKHKSEQRAKAVEQLLKFRKEIPKVWKLLCGSEISPNIPIHFALCFPNAFLGESKKPEELNLLRLDTSYFSHPTKMREFFTSNMTANMTELEQFDLQKFACQLAAYRSGEFTSLYENAMKVHQLLNSQIASTDPVPLDLEATKWNGNYFNWTAPQLAVIENFMKNKDKCKHQLILGWPGTGKTLVLLEISRRLALMGEKVCIVARTDELKNKFETFFVLNIPTEKYRPDVVKNELSAMPSCSNHMYRYIFYEEFSVDPEANRVRDSTTFNLLALKAWLESLKAQQTIFIIVNGGSKPLRFRIYYNTFIRTFEGMPNVSLQFFSTVLRSTKQIYDVTRSLYERDSIDTSNMMLGHNVSGPCVTKMVAADFSTSMAEVISVIECLRRQTTAGNKLYSQMLIIVEAVDYLPHNEKRCVESFFKNAAIPCASVMDQMTSKDPKVALCLAKELDLDEDILSLEWPIVLVAQTSPRLFEMLDRHSNWYTRCTSRLYIIERPRLIRRPPINANSVILETASGIVAPKLQLKTDSL